MDRMRFWNTSNIYVQRQNKNKTSNNFGSKKTKYQQRPLHDGSHTWSRNCLPFRITWVHLRISGAPVAQSLVFCICFVYVCLSFYFYMYLCNQCWSPQNVAARIMYKSMCFFLLLLLLSPSIILTSAQSSWLVLIDGFLRIIWFAPSIILTPMI